MTTKQAQQPDEYRIPTWVCASCNVKYNVGQPCRLHQAAPDLLAALEAAVEGEAWQSSRDRPGVAPEWLLHAKAAIAAATGGQP